MNADEDRIVSEQVSGPAKKQPHPGWKPPPMPLFEKAGWAVLLSGVAVLVYFALTRST